VNGLVIRVIQAAHGRVVRPAWRRFEHAVQNCEAAQRARLHGLLRSNAATAYGRAHRFESISSVREWQDRVPLVDYDAIASWIERAAAGEPNVLTAAPVRRFERTSGSTAPNKLVPYTPALLHEFAAATGPWLYDLHTSCPGLRGTTTYWSISPATRQSERTDGGIAIGFTDDTEYFSAPERFALRRMLAVPPAVARVREMDAWADATARHLVAAENLGLISVWHPSFFTLLLQRIEDHLDTWLDAVSPRRRAAVRQRLQSGTLGEALWPRLAVVSCWADAAAARAVPALARALPHARIQPKGLLATEGVVSFPLMREDASPCVAAVAGHFLEFVDLDRPTARPRLAHELEPGASYAPVVSTGGGFYRYRLGDAVSCTGFHAQAPVLRFDGRIDHVSDLVGEKLNPHLVASALREAEQATGANLTFALIAPAADGPPRYCLYAEGVDDATLGAIRRIVEQRLCGSHGYRYARALGQLSALRAVPVQDGASRYLRARAAAGQRTGDIKPTDLDNRLDWSAVFGEAAETRFVSAEATS
jgi:hypothetical protein